MLTVPGPAAQESLVASCAHAGLVLSEQARAGIRGTRVEMCGFVALALSSCAEVTPPFTQPPTKGVGVRGKADIRPRAPLPLPPALRNCEHSLMPGFPLLPHWEILSARTRDSEIDTLNPKP